MAALLMTMLLLLQQPQLGAAGGDTGAIDDLRCRRHRGFSCMRGGFLFGVKFNTVGSSVGHLHLIAEFGDLQCLRI